MPLFLTAHRASSEGAPTEQLATSADDVETEERVALDPTRLAAWGFQPGVTPSLDHVIMVLDNRFVNDVLETTVLYKQVQLIHFLLPFLPLFLLLLLLPFPLPFLPPFLLLRPPDSLLKLNALNY